MKLFRYIRQQLLGEGKFSKHLLYAVGEIILVVIGILIAVGIGNWNEQRKLRESASLHIIALKEDLNKDLAQLEALKAHMDQNIHSCDELLAQFKTIKPLDSLTSFYMLSLILEANFTPNKIGFSTLENKGELSVMSEQTQNRLREYYALTEQIGDREEITNHFIRDKLEPMVFGKYAFMWNKEVEWYLVKPDYADDPREIRRINTQEFLADKPLESIAYARLYQSTTQIEVYKKAINEVKELIAQIDTP